MLNLLNISEETSGQFFQEHPLTNIHFKLNYTFSRKHDSKLVMFKIQPLS